MRFRWFVAGRAVALGALASCSQFSNTASPFYPVARTVQYASDVDSVTRITTSMSHEMSPTINTASDRLAYRVLELDDRAGIEATSVETMRLASNEAPARISIDRRVTTAPRYASNDASLLYGALQHGRGVLVRAHAEPIERGTTFIPYAWMFTGPVTTGPLSVTVPFVSSLDVSPSSERIAVSVGATSISENIETNPVYCSGSHRHEETSHNGYLFLLNALFAGQRCGTAVHVRTTRNNEVPLIATQKMDGSDVIRLGEGSDPAFSPDGKRIVYVDAESDDTLVIVDATTGAVNKKISAGAHGVASPTWSPDGRFIVFTWTQQLARPTPQAPPNDNFTDMPTDWELEPPITVTQLAIVGVNDESVYHLTDGVATVGHPRFASDGSLYFDSNASGSFDIWRMRIKPR